MTSCNVNFRHLKKDWGNKVKRNRAKRAWGQVNHPSERPALAQDLPSTKDEPVRVSQLKPTLQAARSTQRRCS